MKFNSYSRTKNTVLGIFTGLGGQLISIILRFITRTVFIYTLGKVYLGISGLFSDVLAMLSLAELGFGTAIIYRLYKPLADNDEHRVRILLKFYKQIYQLVGMVILLLGLCLLPFLPVLIKDYGSLGALGIKPRFIYILFLFKTVSSYFFFAYRTAILSADQKQYVVNATKIICEILTCVIQIAILYLTHNYVLYILVAICLSIALNLTNAIIAIRAYPQYFIKEEDNLSRGEVVSMVKDSGALLLYKINTVVHKSTGNLILSAFIGLSTVGVYSNYVLFYTTIKGFLGQIYSGIKSSMGNLYAVSEVETKYFFFEVMNFLTIVLYGTVAVLVALVSDELINVWIGQDYIIPQPFAILIGAEILSWGLKSNLGQIRNITGLFRQMWYRPLMSIIICLVTTLLLIKTIGIYAIPIGILTADLTTNIAVDPGVIHKYGFANYKKASFYYKKNLGYVAVLLAAGFVSYGICSVLVLKSGWLSVILHSIICMTCVLLSLFIIYGRTRVVEFLIDKAWRIIKRESI